MQENKAGKTKGTNRKENHQGRITQEEETKAPLHRHKAITPIPVMMDQTKVEEEEAVTQDGGRTEETLSTHKSQ